MLRAIKVRLYQTESQKQHLAQAFGCVRWVWNQSLVTMSQTYKETGKGISALTMKKQLPAWKKEYEWLKTCYSQCLQQSVLNLSQAFINFFDGRARYPTFKNRHGRQSLQYPQNVKVLSDSEIKFPGLLGIVKAKIHRSLTEELKTVTLSKMPDGRYYASLLIDDFISPPDSNSDGKAIGIDLGLIDFVVTSEGSKYQNPKHLNKIENNLKRKQRQLARKKDKTTAKRRKAKLAVAKVYSKISRIREDFLHKLSRKIVNENQVIVVENLAVKNMVKNHNLAKSISDSEALASLRASAG
jgi:putative transposase